MISAIIAWSLRNRALVLLASLALAVAGVLAIKQTPVDAIPDLSDVQVIVRTNFPGQSPQVVEDQVTYPLTTTLLSVPGATTVRGYSFFGDSFVYVIFEDGTDMYWARARVQEYLGQVSSSLPAGVQPELGPDATGVGWVYQYALVSEDGSHDISEMRALQDWFLKFELQSVPGVSEVATVGGQEKQYQLVVDPDALRQYDVTLAQIKSAINMSNAEVSGSVIEMAEAEYMVRATGYIDSVEDFSSVAIKTADDGTPVYLSDLGRVTIGPTSRRGIAELNGEGEVVGGIVIMRFGENARAVIDAVKARLEELKHSLPEGVSLVSVYDRSGLIDRSVSTLSRKLVEELLVVLLVCAVFLAHLRSSLVIIITLPLGLLAAFLIMRVQGLNANIMSLGGIAIALGAMVDAAIVMVEALHKRMESPKYASDSHWQHVLAATKDVGPPIFFSLLIITLSFLPVFALQAQEGRLFAPLAYTKTYAMAAAAALSITLVPVLMGYFVRGKVMPEHRNPLNRLVLTAYRPVLDFALKMPVTVIVLSLAVVLSSAWAWRTLGTEFMPELNEGDLMYMPTTYPGISAGEAAQLLQQTDKLIMQVPEVAQVFGKIGRAETATDPAPLTMIESVIRLKPQTEWRTGLTIEDIKAELNEVVQIPGLTNAWVWPIKTRIDMLATGIKTPVGIKIAGPDMAVIQEIGEQIEALLPEVPGTASVFAEKVQGGRYLTVDIDRLAVAQYGLHVGDIHEVIRLGVGGMQLSTAVEGRERYPISVRFPRDIRDSLQEIRELPLNTPSGAWINLGDVAEVRIEAGPPMLKSENARLNGWVYVDLDTPDLGGYVRRARAALEQDLTLPSGYSLSWSGQYQYLERAQERLQVVVPATVAIIVMLLYMSFRRWRDVAIIMVTIPMALSGSVWLLYALDFNLSVAVGVGFIALAGVAVETGVVMLVYLKQALSELEVTEKKDQARLRAAIREGALLRVRPIMMTVATIFIGLLPIMFADGTGAEVMKRIAAPMVGGTFSALVLTLVVIPAVFLLIERRMAKG